MSGAPAGNDRPLARVTWTVGQPRRPSLAGRVASVLLVAFAQWAWIGIIFALVLLAVAALACRA